MKALKMADQAERTAGNRLDSDLEEWALGAEIDLRACVKELRRLAAVEADCAQYLKEGETPAERIKRALGDSDSLMSLYRDVVAERDALKAELETERMRLAACGVVAMSNTKESAERNRNMLPEYWSASCADVASAVDREMALRAELERIKALEPVAWIVEGQNMGGGVSQYLAWKKSGAGQVPAPLQTEPTPLYALGSKT